MKIEKLTDNKIRIVIDSYELEKNNINISKLSNFTLEKQTFFNDLIEKVQKEIDFITDGYKLLVETFTNNNDYLVLILTKCPYHEFKRPIVKRKQLPITDTNAIYIFDTLNNFIAFCTCIRNKCSLKIKYISKKNSLYYYENTYFLLLKNISNLYEYKIIFNSLISEFGNYVSYSDLFENKLIEYGDVIIKNNAIEKGIKYLI